jgi:hypothetical protein
MTRAAAIIGIIFLAACGKPTDKESVTITTHGSKLPDLVFAANAPVFDPGGATFVEAVWTDGVWKIHDEGVWIADGTDEDGISKIMQGIKDKRPDSRVLISAEKRTAFREIETMVRGVASAGLTDINFLVARGSPKPETHAFHLELPKIGEEDRIPWDPFVIQLDAQGAVHSGTGIAASTLDPATSDHALPGLNSQLELFASAARAVEIQGICLVHIEPAASYQRVIDLMSRFHEHRVLMRFTNFRIDPPGSRTEVEPQSKPRKKPSPPRKVLGKPSHYIPIPVENEDPND